MSNILVLKNYTISDHTKWYGDRTSETDLVQNYQVMENLCVSSAKTHLIGLDDIIVHRNNAPDIRTVFKLHFSEIYQVWKQGHNILYSDLDVLFVKPVEYFDQFKYFSMFNYTDPSSTVDTHYNVSFPHYFNCGIRYYPANMDHSVWDIGFEMLENWDPSRWDAEQIIYNAMMWSQSDNVQDFYRPDLAYQYLVGVNENNVFNRIDVSSAKAIHFHGSRGSKYRLDIMQSLYLQSTEL